DQAGGAQQGVQQRQRPGRELAAQHVRGQNQATQGGNGESDQGRGQQGSASWQAEGADPVSRTHGSRRISASCPLDVASCRRVPGLVIGTGWRSRRANRRARGGCAGGLAWSALLRVWGRVSGLGQAARAEQAVTTSAG